MLQRNLVLFFFSGVTAFNIRTHKFVYTEMDCSALFVPGQKRLWFILILNFMSEKVLFKWSTTILYLFLVKWKYVDVSFIFIFICNCNGTVTTIVRVKRLKITFKNMTFCILLVYFENKSNGTFFQMLAKLVLIKIFYSLLLPLLYNKFRYIHPCEVITADCFPAYSYFLHLKEISFKTSRKWPKSVR